MGGCDWGLLLLSDSARSFLKKKKVGRFNEEEASRREAEQVKREEEKKTAAAAIAVGNRCQVHVAGQPTKTGTVMYVGEYD